MGESYTCAEGGVISGGRHRFPPGNHRIAIWGQSNAVGRADQADLSASPLSSDAGLAAFMDGTFSRVYIWTGSAYAQLNASNNGCTSGQFGAEFGLAVRWMRETTSGNLYIEKEAYSSVSISYFDPTVWQYYATSSAGMVGRRIAANAWLASNGVTVADSGFLWVQGEADSAQSQSWYQTRIETLIAARETDGMQTLETKRILVQMAVGSASYGSGVASAKNAIVASSPSNTTAPSMPYYMKPDNLHANGRGQVQMGYDAFEYIFGASHIAT